MTATFCHTPRTALRETAYIACNAYADYVFNAQGDATTFVGPAPATYFQQCNWDFSGVSDIGRLEHVWRHDSGKGGHNPPRYVTDRAIDVGRKHDFNRMIVHYAQPHSPYVSNANAEDRDLYEHEDEPFAYLRAGGDRQQVLQAYLADLRYVLDEVALLCDNIDGEVVVSADHGEAFGKYGTYKHPIGSLHPKVRFVPWARTTGHDRGEYEPKFDPERTSTTERSVDETLRALGYRE